jgi:hypothetical protein
MAPFLLGERLAFPAVDGEARDYRTNGSSFVFVLASLAFVSLKEFAQEFGGSFRTPLAQQFCHDRSR